MGYGLVQKTLRREVDSEGTIKHDSKLHPE